ncbi:hypothetical protein MSMEI_0315 [Mycolicibacterium smegmatis MC2 155]|uniref:Uncharacterized protein n=1 Tax=Mycolicibacterium smegmatis (strain ATCC 700084 / mc(2)155) TaxID=246196 RepID=I7G1K7_MYCS2|nr:hypothetical protein MSMEI_0315 [Mycolicibacterium smegmatis MC2 155]
MFGEAFDDVVHRSVALEVENQKVLVRRCRTRTSGAAAGELQVVLPAGKAEHHAVEPGVVLEAVQHRQVEDPGGVRNRHVSSVSWGNGAHVRSSSGVEVKPYPWRQRDAPAVRSAGGRTLLWTI